MEGHVLLPLPHGLQITEIHQEETVFIVEVLSEQTVGRCPLCEEESFVVPIVSFIGLFVYKVVNRKELAAKQ